MIDSFASFNLFLDSILNLDSIALWHLRTESGKLFDEFVSQKYVSLGWNYLTKQKLSSTSDTALKSAISEIYDSKRPGAPYNQAHDFIFEMSEGDIVIFPSANSTHYCFALIGEYFESDFDNADVNERKFFEDYEANVEIFNITNPHIKRRKIEVIIIIESYLIPPRVRLVLRNYGASMRLEEHKDECLGLIFPYFWFDQKLYLNFVTRMVDPGAFNYGRLLVNLTNLIVKDAAVSRGDIDFRSNISSPGLTQLLVGIRDEFGGALGVLWGLFLANLFLQGGKIKTNNFEFQIPSLISIVERIRNRKTNALLRDNDYLKAQLDNINLKEELSIREKQIGGIITEDEDHEMINSLKAKGYTVKAPGQLTLLDEIEEDATALGLREQVK